MQAGSFSRAHPNWRGDVGLAIRSGDTVAAIRRVACVVGILALVSVVLLFGVAVGLGWSSMSGVFDRGAMDSTY